LTASHVIPEDVGGIEVSFNHGSFPAEFLKRDEKADLALIFIRTNDPKGFTIAPIGTTSVNAQQGYYIYGHPAGDIRQEQKIVHFKSYSELDKGVISGVSGSGVFHNGELFGVVIRSDYHKLTIVVPTHTIRGFVGQCTPWGCPVPQQPSPGQKLPPTLPPEPLPEELLAQQILERLEAMNPGQVDLSGLEKKIDGIKIEAPTINYEVNFNTLEQ
jgi:hypothetical protein